MLIAMAAAPLTAFVKSSAPAAGVKTAEAAGCMVAQTNVWASQAFAAQAGTFTVSFDATPGAYQTDAAVGLSAAPAKDYSAFGPMVRFSSASRMIDARNGAAFAAAGPISYRAGTSYHFRMVVDVAHHAYSAYVTPPGRQELLIGKNFAFRTEQANVASLAYWTPIADVATMQVCNWSVSSSSTSAPTTAPLATFVSADTGAPSVPQNVFAAPASNTSMKITWTASTDNIGVKGYNLFQDGRLVVKTANTNTSYTVTGLVAPTKHTYTVSAYDAAGNVSGISAGAIGIINKPTTQTTFAPTPTPTPTVTPSASGSYDQGILADHPVAFFDMKATGSTESDVSGHGFVGTYKGSVPGTAALPDGERVADFNGSNYLTIPSASAFSIPTTGSFTWEAWVRADVANFAKESSDGYTDWMGKCFNYGPNCEWESRMYANSTSQGRPDRLSAYVFNPSAGLGSAADWQPSSGQIATGQWVHVVGEYTTGSSPSNCSNTGSYPGSINIWVDGVLWSQASHAPTGCMSQYSVKPQAGSSPVTIGTMALDYMFQGAVGKVAFYNYLLPASEIAKHYAAMTGKSVVGSCAQTCTL